MKIYTHIRYSLKENNNNTNNNIQDIAACFNKQINHWGMKIVILQEERINIILTYFISPSLH